MDVLISYSGTKIEQIPTEPKKKDSKILVLRPGSTKSVSEQELEAIKAWMGKAKFARFVQEHRTAPEKPRSVRSKDKPVEPDKPIVPTKEDPEKPKTKTVKPKPVKGSG